MSRLASDRTSAAAVIGSRGGLGAAFVAALTRRGRHDHIHAFGRRRTAPHGDTPASVHAEHIDVLDETSIRAAAAALRAAPELVLVATGQLHGDGMSPERSFAALDLDALTHSFQVNAAGPALVAKHFLPLFPKDRPAVFAALSARVGSIEDNRLGGWYGYRASKAALNMLIRCLAVELRRSRPLAVCVALHPGTVDTALSRPFQRGVAADRLFSPADAAERLLQVIDGLTPADSGGFFAYDGQGIPF